MKLFVITWKSVSLAFVTCLALPAQAQVCGSIQSAMAAYQDTATEAQRMADRVALARRYKSPELAQMESDLIRFQQFQAAAADRVRHIQACESQQRITSIATDSPPETTPQPDAGFAPVEVPLVTTQSAPPTDTSLPVHRESEIVAVPRISPSDTTTALPRSFVDTVGALISGIPLSDTVGKASLPANSQ